MNEIRLKRIPHLYAIRWHTVARLALFILWPMKIASLFVIGLEALIRMYPLIFIVFVCVYRSFIHQIYQNAEYNMYGYVHSLVNL